MSRPAAHRNILESNRDAAMRWGESDVMAYMTDVAPSMLKYLANNPQWHDDIHLWSYTYIGGTPTNWDAWEMLLEGLMSLGHIIVVFAEHKIYVRISASGFLKEALHEQNRA